MAGGAFLAIALARPDAFGLGDVKLIATMGLFLGGAVLARSSSPCARLAARHGPGPP